MTCPYFHTPSLLGLQVICPYCGEVGPTASPEPINAARSEAKPIEVEEVARIIDEWAFGPGSEAEPGSLDKRVADDRARAALTKAQAILSKLQAGEGGTSVAGDASTPSGRTEGLHSAGWLDFNVNYIVRVRLTDFGLKRLRANHDAVFSGWPEPPAYREPQPEGDGWYRMQLWNLMQELGGSMVMGRPVPFETTIQIPAEHLVSSSAEGGAGNLAGDEPLSPKATP